MTGATPTKCKIRFLPDNVEVSVDRGTILLAAALAGGVHVNASCGGNGICGSCKIVIESGEVQCTRSKALSDEEFAKGIRLACQSAVLSDLTVFVPLKSKMDKAVQSRERKQSSGVSASGWAFDPPLRKYYLELPMPSLNDNASDLSRVMRGLKQKYELGDLPVDLEIIRKLPEALRTDNGKVTLTTLIEPIKPDTKTRPLPKITNIESGDTRSRHQALAIDIGTTTVCGQLLDLNQGTTLADAIVFNKQINYGADVIARIAFTQKPGIAGAKMLQEAVIGSINEVIDELLAQSHADRKDIGYISVAGNTTMTQMLLGLESKYIRLSPYVPIANFFPLIKARSLNINVAEHVYLYVFPSVSSYIGGDIVSGIIAAGIHQRSELTFFMDVGTNGEIVIGNSDWMVTASCSAGPAFEGGGIKFGMVAMKGAIQDFTLDRVSLEPVYHTIGEVKPKGICGSGLINAIAELLKACVIGQNGKFHTDLSSKRIRKGSEGYEYVIAWAEETQPGTDITLSEADIDNLIRSKAAMYAGCDTLSKSVNITPPDFEKVILAGNFGSSLNIEQAIMIGLLPDIPRERFAFIGNSSLSGARLATFSTELLDDSIKVAQMMTNIELSENLDFTNNYIAALFLPHTEEKSFPSVTQKIKECSGQSIMRGS